jgi:hypothetical protein
LAKNRAGLLRHRTFRDSSPSEDGVAVVEFVDRPRREVGAIVQRLWDLTDNVRQRSGDRGGRLFMTAAVSPDFQLRFDRWQFARPQTSFRRWLEAVGIRVDGPSDIRRLRKSTKVEKAIAFGGRIADAANDHHEETFRGHYAQGTTLRVLSGQVIVTSQEHWLRQALDGPTVLATSTEVLAEQDRLDALGLTEGQAEELRQGALDMGVTSCRDPYDSPFSPQGQLCAVAPLRCLECRNAWVLPSNLPQLLLFADHLDRLRHRLAPEHFAALWGQSYVNLHAALAERTAEEKALARKHIAAGEASLHLPLSSHVEFDS